MTRRASRRSFLACLLGAVGLLVGCPADGEWPPAEPCGRVDLLQAPPPRDEPGVGRLVPVDIDSTELYVTIDTETQSLSATSWTRFVAGPQEGRSVLQLLRQPATLRIDHVDLDPASLERIVVSDPPRSLVVLPEVFEPCSDHQVEVTYSVTPDDVGPARLPRLEIGPEAAWWSSAQEDGEPDSMLEVWMVSNLLFDRFPITLSVDLWGTDAPHALAANADVYEAEEGSWLVEFPTRQKHGSFWVLYPSDAVETATRSVPLPGGRAVEIDARRFVFDDGVDLAAVLDEAEATLLEYDERLGPYLHGDRYLAWMRSDLAVSMEYEGATLSTPGALKHEMAHSWWARGVAPVSDHHGWMDEGVALWATGAQPFLSTPVPVDTPGVRLLTGEDDWSGASLGPQHYVQGAIVFAGIADRVGVDNLLGVLSAFLEEQGPVAISTEELERLLYCELGERPYVLDMFHAKVRGLEGSAPTPPDPYCASP